MLILDRQSQWQESVRENIRKHALLSKGHLLMNALAATIASYGLLSDSPAVVIGAMIVAMLLGPIVGISLAMVDSDAKSLIKSTLSLFSGVITVLAIAFIIGSIHRDIPITNEILSRTTPSLPDLMIALAVGTAGAYATVSFHINLALVGVAIAAALVLPLSSASILLARGEVGLALGAFELVLVNLVAIQFSSSVVLWLTGFRRITRGAGQPISTFLKQNLLSIAILFLLGVSLSVHSRKEINKQVFETRIRVILRTKINSSLESYVSGIRIEDEQEFCIVRAVVRGPNPPSSNQIASIEKLFPISPNGKTVILRIRFVKLMIIDHDGLLNTNMGFDSDE